MVARNRPLKIFISLDNFSALLQIIFKFALFFSDITIINYLVVCSKSTFGKFTTALNECCFSGVVKELRKQGIASFLLENLIAHLTSGDNYCTVKAVYLHVLTTNNAAISFYEHRGFRPHLFLPYYYAIGGSRRDGFTYVLYLNGGHPPWRLLDYVGHCCQLCFNVLSPWALTKAAFRKFNGAWFNAMPRIRQIAHGTTALFS